jgi:hypothetical protein
MNNFEIPKEVFNVYAIEANTPACVPVAVGGMPNFLAANIASPLITRS